MTRTQWIQKASEDTTRNWGSNPIINFMGPPCAGKSTVASQFVLDHPYFTYCTIDGFRLKYQDEDLAWEKLLETVEENTHVVLETCGLSYRLEELFSKLDSRPTISILLFARSEKCRTRLLQRKKRRLPEDMAWSLPSELEAIEYALDNLSDTVLVPDIERDTSDLSESELYEQVSKEIVEKLLNPTDKIQLRRTLHNVKGNQGSLLA